MQNKIPSDEYARILENMPVCCVDVIIANDKKALLVYRKDEPAKNKWWVVGGRILKNEKLEDAVIRKVLEETGLESKIERQIGVYEFKSDKAPFKVRTGVHNIVIVYVVKPIQNLDNIQINSTSADYKWIDRIEKNLDPYIKKLLRDSGIFS